MNRSEQATQIAIVEFCRMAIKRPDRYWWVPNGTHLPNVKTRGIYQRMGLTAGVFDLHFVWATGKCRQFPCYGVIEVKAGKNKLTDEQAQFSRDLCDLGWPWAEARSVEDVERTLRGWGVTLHATVLPTGVILKR